MGDAIEFVQVLETTDPTEIEVIRSILIQTGIEHYFKGLALGRIFPTINKPVRLMVEKSRVEQARELLKGHGKH